MSRSGYSDDWDCDRSGQWRMICYRGAVASAIRGARGQKVLRAILDAMDALPEKRLIADSLQDKSGEFCALGALGRARGIDMTDVDAHDREQVAAIFDIAPALASEIVFENDECVWNDTPENRFRRMRRWVASHVNRPLPTQANGGSE